MLFQFDKNSHVLFIGDSITFANNFVARIFDFYRTHLHDSHVIIRNAGVSGGTAECALLYLDDELLAFPASHAVVTLGVNDSRFCNLNIPDEAERSAALKHSYDDYSARMRMLVERLSLRGIKTILCTPPPYAEYFATAKEPVRHAHALLSMYAEVVRKLAREYALPFVDLHARLSEIYLDEPLYISDHVHPNNAGHARMAECFLSSQGLPVRDYRPCQEPEKISPAMSR